MRSLTSGAQAALAASSIVMTCLVEMDFDTPVFFTAAVVDIDWNGKTWLRAGPVGTIDTVKDSSDPTEQLKFVLSGVPSENLSLALGQSVRNKPCRIFLAILDSSTQAVLDASLIWAGLMDQLPISEDPNNNAQSVISVTSKHIGTLFSRVKVLKYTAGDQQKVSPGDTSLRFISSQSIHKDVWPAAAWGRV